jgi:hypothetical protein
MPALRAHASLVLNRNLNAFDHWDEKTILARGGSLFEVAKKIWRGPLERKQAFDAPAAITAS